MKRTTVLGISFALVSASAAGAQATREEGAPATAPTVVSGIVLTPEGRPARGAIVVTSAGGKTVSGEDGSFRLEVELPLDALDVQATAVSSAGAATVAGSTRIAVAPGASSSGAVLLLGQGGCNPHGVPTFGGVAALEGAVFDMVVFDDGSGSGPLLVAGGNMTSAGTLPVSGLATWDGAAWSPLGFDMDGAVQALAVFDDGSGSALYAAGLFTTASGISANRIVRWDGTSWSALGAGLNNVVQALEVFDDGSGPALYAGGAFTTAGGVAANRVARWDGTSWSALGAGTNTTVFALAAVDIGSGPALYAGGDFTLAGGAFAIRVASWDGSSWSSLDSWPNGLVGALAGFDDGSGMALYASGAFNSAGGSPTNNVAKWDGTSWSPLGSGIGGGGLLDFATFDDGDGPKLYGGGYFTSAGGVAARFVASWDGTSWAPLGDGTLDHGGLALAVFDDGSGHGAELFTQAWAWNGTDWRELEDPAPLDDEVWALAVHDSGAGASVLYAGGDFLNAGGTPVSGVARWDGAWLPLGSGIDARVHSLALYDDGGGGGTQLYAGGNFSTAGGVAANRIARWDGASWSPLGSGTNGTVRALAVFDDGSGPALFAGGPFTSAGGIPASCIARWNGTVWGSIGSVSGSNNLVRALATFDDGTGTALYVGGRFISAGAVPCEGIARWDGTSWSALGSGVRDGGAQGDVHALAVFDDGSGPALYAAGVFTLAGGVAASNVARWDGASWSALGSGVNGSVFSLAAFDDGAGSALYAGGALTTAGGVAANRIARWDGTSWSPLGVGVSAPVNASTVFDDGASGPALIVGGRFLDAFDAGDSYVARWQGCVDTGPPVLSMPESVTAYDGLGGSPGTIVTFSVTASDFFDPAPNVVCVPPSGSFFPRGTTLVQCTATDAEGNQSSGDFPVIVQPRVRTATR